MKLLFIGDVVGKHGCAFLSSKLYGIKREYGIDMTVVNGENSAAGNGITRTSVRELMNAGADVITTGNHAFKWHDQYDLFENDKVVRPANYPEECPGRGMCTMDFGGFSVAVINVMGTLFMEGLDNPFHAVDRLIAKAGTPNIFVDFHAEATSEKKVMGHYLAGRVTAVLGTHTHVQTSDEIILEGHTGYITDAGMTGAEFSVLGIKTSCALKKMRLHMPNRFTEADGPCILNGVVVDFQEDCGKCSNIERLIIR